MASEFELATGQRGAVGEVTADVAGVEYQWKTAGLVQAFSARPGIWERLRWSRRAGSLRIRSQLQGSRGVGMCARDREGGAMRTSAGSFHQHI